MIFADGSGSILLQNYTLADGQICVRATYSWEGRAANNSLSVYPRESFDWLAAADKLAALWIAGPESTAPSIQDATLSDESLAIPSQDPVAATG